MQQIAVFVDAGYLYAQGSAAISGQKQERQKIALKVESTISSLVIQASQVAPSTRLLRIYWYDGILRNGRLTQEQSEIANSHNVKLRLGMINSFGQQKGVDSLIVTDMVDLARNKAITDALLLAGDEDVRIGMNIAQTYGVRVHLLGIQPAQGSQSPDLRQDADTTWEWTRDLMQTCLSVTLPSPADPSSSPAPAPLAPEQGSGRLSLDAAIEREITTLVEGMEMPDKQRAYDYIQQNRGQVPLEIDRPLLGKVRNAIGRNLGDDERKTLRDRLRKALTP